MICPHCLKEVNEPDGVVGKDIAACRGGFNCDECGEFIKFSELIDKIKKPLCPYCSAEWTDEMIKIKDVNCDEACNTCGHISNFYVTIDIICAACGRLIYRKEGIQYDS